MLQGRMDIIDMERFVFFRFPGTDPRLTRSVSTENEGNDYSTEA